MGRTRAGWRSAFWAATVLVVSGVMIGCGTSSGTIQDTVIDLDPEVVTADAATEDLSELNDDQLFREGNEHLEFGDPHEALRRYTYLLETFPESELVRASIYNSGLCYEQLDRWDMAASMYRDVTERWPETDDAKDALFRWAEARAQLGDWEGVPALMERALNRAGLTVTDRCEGHLRWANAAIEVRDYATAEAHYREVLSVNRAAELNGGTDPEDMPLVDYNPILIQANFGLGRTYHELFLEIRLVLPQDAIMEALVDKSQLLEQAKEAYLNAVQGGHPYWSIAAGFMIGQLYEDFYLDVLACEVPHDFDSFTMAVYFEELREFLSPVIERAMSVYENTLGMAERMGADSIWVEETRRGIERIQGYLYDPDVRSAQEQEILEQRHPHSAQDPDRAWSPPPIPET